MEIRPPITSWMGETWEIMVKLATLALKTV